MLVARLLAGDERPQAVVLLAARGAAFEVVAHPRDATVGVRALQLQLDVPVEQLEALLAADLVPFGPSILSRSRFVMTAPVRVPA